MHYKFIDYEAIERWISFKNKKINKIKQIKVVPINNKKQRKHKRIRTTIRISLKKIINTSFKKIINTSFKKNQIVPITKNIITEQSFTVMEQILSLSISRIGISCDDLKLAQIYAFISSNHPNIIHIGLLIDNCSFSFSSNKYMFGDITMFSNGTYKLFPFIEDDKWFIIDDTFTFYPVINNPLPHSNTFLNKYFFNCLKV